MNSRTDLVGVLARDPRYTIDAYDFVFQALEFTKRQKKTKTHSKTRASQGEFSRHVSPRELCEGARDLALRSYGFLAYTVLKQWGIHSTSDLGEIVFNLIATGDLEKTPSDSRADFDHAFDLETALKRDFVVVLDDVA
jgi:uncharacterized repeat protein (TIGR04138 family)